MSASKEGALCKWLVHYENHNTNNRERGLQLDCKTWTQMSISFSHTLEMPSTVKLSWYCLVRKELTWLSVCISIKNSLHIVMRLQSKPHELNKNTTDTHLRQKGPRLRLCPRRRCLSGVGKLPPTRAQGTLQNRHVKSQARESHWKKIQICCAKNTNNKQQSAFFKLIWLWGTTETILYTYWSLNPLLRRTRAS